MPMVIAVPPMACKEISAKARADFDKSLAINPKYAEAYRMRGSVHAMNGLLDEALADYTHAIQLQPKQQSDYCARGSIYETKGQLARRKTTSPRPGN